jgi:hypothetical protein
LGEQQLDHDDHGIVGGWVTNRMITLINGISMITMVSMGCIAGAAAAP